MSGKLSPRTKERVRGQIAVWLKENFPAGERSLLLSEVYHLAISLLKTMQLPPNLYEQGLSEKTLRFYKRSGILSKPGGNTSNARYGLSHVLQAAIARIAGALPILTLTEASERVKNKSNAELSDFLAELIYQVRFDYFTRPASLPLAPEHISHNTSRKIEKSCVNQTITIFLKNGVIVTIPHEYTQKSEGKTIEEIIQKLTLFFE